MRRIISAAFLSVLVGSLVLAADQTPEKIRFPISTAPVPNPTAITTLTADRLYVIDSDIPVIVLASPEGLVSVTEESGPIKIRGKFIDGTGKTETRTYKGKSVYSIEALATGRVELLIVPAGSTKVADVIRKMVDVDAGTGPSPPPKPPDPKPPGPADPLLGVLQAAYDAEPATATKVSDKHALAATFRALANAITDPVVKDGDDNFALITNSIQASIDGRLKTKLRPTIGAEINKILPNGPSKGAVALTAQNRTDAAALYLRIATLLDQVK